MIAYKGFTKDLTATMGKGIYHFKPGKTYRTEKSKTVRTGFHCCENPFECLFYYPINGENRFFMVEAGGSIDEDDGERIACTEITLLKELSLKELAGHGMMYMVRHPLRKNWKQRKRGVEVTDAETETARENEIVIVRGTHPVVSGEKDSILGLILEPEPGNIKAAKLFVPGEDAKANTRYTLTEDRTLLEV